MDPSDKIIPHENDILLGRGGKNNRHIGNDKLRTLARTYVEAYTRSTKKGKSNISWDLVKAVRSMKPPGRFLKRDSVSGTWQDIGDDAAREKTSQAMRDAIAVSIDNHIFGQQRYVQDAQSLPRATSRTNTFVKFEQPAPTWGTYPPWISSHAHSYPQMYTSPRNTRPRSSTADSVLVSPEKVTSMSFPLIHGSLHNPTRSVSFSEYPHPQPEYPYQQRWARSPECHYPPQRLCEGNGMELDMRPLNSWDDDDDDDDGVDFQPLPLNGIDYSSSTLTHGEDYERLFPHPWNDPPFGS